jgi:hypothetical protein
MKPTLPKDLEREIVDRIIGLLKEPKAWQVRGRYLHLEPALLDARGTESTFEKSMRRQHKLENGVSLRRGLFAALMGWKLSEPDDVRLRWLSGLRVWRAELGFNRRVAAIQSEKRGQALAWNLGLAEDVITNPPPLSTSDTIAPLSQRQKWLEALKATQRRASTRLDDDIPY